MCLCIIPNEWLGTVVYIGPKALTSFDFDYPIYDVDEEEYPEEYAKQDALEDSIYYGE